LTVNFMPPDAQFLTQRDYALSRGHDPALLTRWKKRGRVVMVGRLVDAAATDEKLKATMDVRRLGVVHTKVRQGHGADADIDEIRRQRARREKAMADEAERRARIGSRDFVDRKGVNHAIGDVGQVIGQHFESFVARTGAEISAEFGIPERAAITTLERAVDRLREAIAAGISELATRYRDPESAKDAKHD
jgi:hypothetical protein